MPNPPLNIGNESMQDIKSRISNTIENGGHIRQTLASYSHGAPYDTAWEVKAAVEALHVFASRWTIEILSTLYIAGPRRFNQMKNLLEGISSRTLSDKLRFLVDEGLVTCLLYTSPSPRDRG